MNARHRISPTKTKYAVRPVIVPKLRIGQKPETLFKPLRFALNIAHNSEIIKSESAINDQKNG